MKICKIIKFWGRWFFLDDKKWVNWLDNPKQKIKFLKSNQKLLYGQCFNIAFNYYFVIIYENCYMDDSTDGQVFRLNQPTIIVVPRLKSPISLLHNIHQ